MKSQELTATLTEAAAERMTQSLQRMPVEKLTFVPAFEGTGRTALNVLCECITLNGNWAEALAAGVHTPPPDSVWGLMAEMEKDPLESLLAKLHTETDRLTAAIRALPDDSLGTIVQSPWLAGLPQIQFAAFPMENMNYHTGQINYIQTLYGDNEG